MAAGSKRIFIHIGTTKTGSSALQAYFSHNAPALEEMGISYPNPENAAIVAHGVCTGNLLHVMQRQASARAFRGTIPQISAEFLLPVLTEAIRASRNDAVLFSGEFLSQYINGNTLNQFNELLSLHKVTVIVFVRDVYDHMVSAWKQRVKKDGETRNLEDFLQHQISNRKAALHRLKSLFDSRLDVRVCNYDCHRSTLIQEFLKEIGLTATDPRLSDLPSPEKNASLSYWQAKTVVMSHEIIGSSRFSALLANRFRIQSDKRRDPYFARLDTILLDALASEIRMCNAYLPEGEKLRDRPRTEQGSDEVPFATSDVAALMKVFGEFMASEVSRPAPPKIAGLPDDFDPAEYLLRNPDVQAAGVNPAFHYLKFGQFEGRVYKAGRKG